MHDAVVVTVIVVARNEERHILGCLESIDRQAVEGVPLEVIVVDGESTDRTVALASRFLDAKTYPHRIIANPKQILAAGWNLGIQAARGLYVLRPDAHAALHPGYIAHGIKVLEGSPTVAAVGGRLVTRASGRVGRAIAIALASKTGVGNSPFRTKTRDGPTDTAVFALYRRELFDRLGTFDESLIRHQDNDFHSRVKRAGEVLHTCTDMVADYHARDSVAGLLRQMYSNGRYMPTIHARGAANARHLAPFACGATVMALLLGALLWPPLAIPPATAVLIYVGCIVAEMTSMAIRLSPRDALLAGALIPMMHTAYAVGTLIGFLNSFAGRVGGGALSPGSPPAAGNAVEPGEGHVRRE